jgi:hypothetical protein
MPTQQNSWNHQTVYMPFLPPEGDLKMKEM